MGNTAFEVFKVTKVMSKKVFQWVMWDRGQWVREVKLVVLTLRSPN